MKQHSTTRKVLSSLLILLCSGVLLAFTFSPNFINSREINSAYSKYLRQPSEENKRMYEETVRRVNRPFWIAQYVSGGLGLLLLFGLVRVWRKRDNLTPVDGDGNQPKASLPHAS